MVPVPCPLTPGVALHAEKEDIVVKSVDEKESEVFNYKYTLHREKRTDSSGRKTEVWGKERLVFHAVRRISERAWKCPRLWFPWKSGSA